MFTIIVGGGKVGANLLSALTARGSEAVLVEIDPAKAAALAADLGSRVMSGDGTELYVLERAGIGRPPQIVVAVTGDDEDNLIICQMARERFGVPKVIARVNDPRNQELFDLLGITPTVCPASRIMSLIEHEVPEHDLVQLLDLRSERLAIVEIEVDPRAPAVGRPAGALDMPAGTRLICVVRDGAAHLSVDSTVILPGDQLLVILESGREPQLREVLLGR